MDAVLARIVKWAEAEDAVRVVVLTSTRARAQGPPDELSDYDVIVTLEDIDRFDAAAAYGTPAARWGDEHDVHGTTTLFCGVVYDDGVKVDWTLWPVNVPRLVAEHGLTDNLDVGYRVLLDKDWHSATPTRSMRTTPSALTSTSSAENLATPACRIRESFQRCGVRRAC